MRLEDAQESLKAYAKDKRPCGGFLTACLENDLMDAVGRADSTSIYILDEIVKFIYNELPAICYGTPEKVSAWLNSREA